MVIVVVVYVTSASKGDTVNEELKQWVGQPTLRPTASPITDREASGIIEQLEAGVLYTRDETFSTMEMNDPRFLALDWILHTDALQLLSDDSHLYQRYALAVLAYALDSRAWYVCGDPGENYTESECYIPVDENTTITSGVWLSSTSECDWFGITCSSDGVVRAVE